MSDCIKCANCGAVSFYEGGKTKIHCITCYNALRAENKRLKEALREIAEDGNYCEDSDNEVGWHIDNAYEVMNELKEKAQQALNEVKE
ncbi:MAG: hypothetical protein PHW40_07255 [Candidatus Izemoplasmatales bacterium]|nr:hypothetical protein [Candidatus Izemoplasmatales bacterium]